MFNKEYDLFLAYHGSYEHNGSKAIADKLYNFMIEKGLNAFYYPKSRRDLYKANIIDVMKSKTFVMICNENLNTLPNGRIDQSLHYELSTEIDAFYALTQFGNDVSVQDSKVLVCGDYFTKRKKGQESELHELFANRTHCFLDGQAMEYSFKEVYDWIITRISCRSTPDSWVTAQTTTEITTVFAKRSFMSQACNLPKMVACSKTIRCLGISNSEMTVKMTPEAVKFALEHGSTIELLFLDPEGEFTRQREEEEKHRPNRIKKITIQNIEHALDLRDELPAEQKERFKLLKYNLQPRINMILLDSNLILQYYANTVAGLSNPCFLIEKKEISPLYDFCTGVYEEIRKSATDIADHYD